MQRDRLDFETGWVREHHVDAPMFDIEWRRDGDNLEVRAPVRCRCVMVASMPGHSIPPRPLRGVNLRTLAFRFLARGVAS